MNTDNQTFEQELQNATRQQPDQEMQTEDNAPALADIEMQPASEDTEMQDRGRPADRLPRSGEAEDEAAKDRFDSRDSALAESSGDRSGQRMEMQERSGPGLLASPRNRPGIPASSSSGMGAADGSDAEPMDSGP